MGLFQVLENRHRLKERRLAVHHQRRHDALRVEGLVLGRVLLAFQQVIETCSTWTPFSASTVRTR